MESSTYALKQPQAHKPKIILWNDLTLHDIECLEKAIGVDEIKKILAEKFNLKNFENDLKEAIVLDLYYYALQFTKESQFDKEQVSTFLSIVKVTHETCIETPFGNIEQCYDYFKELVLCHAIKRPPFSIDLYSTEDVKKILEYVTNTYFRHYKMYKYAFTPQIKLDLTLNYSDILETPPPSIPELADGEIGNELKETTNIVDASVEDGINTEESEKADLVENNDPDLSDEKKEAFKILKSLINQYLADEIKKLKSDMDEQIKSSEDVVNKKIASMDGSGTAKTNRAYSRLKKQR